MGNIVEEFNERRRAAKIARDATPDRFDRLNDVIEDLAQREHIPFKTAEKAIAGRYAYHGAEELKR